jgi:2,3-bisphosphoglycerate-independent phosphoglycerate mutase
LHPFQYTAIGTGGHISPALYGNHSYAAVPFVISNLKDKQGDQFTRLTEPTLLKMLWIDFADQVAKLTKVHMNQ